tara:strand:+ start:238 stop:519 length:282 start_codon:yes stop_codon:yes gene_type:complete
VDTIKKTFFTVGPFAEVEDRVDHFGSSTYLQKLYNDTIGELVETQQAYESAKKLDDSEEIVNGLKKQIEFLESVVALANNNMTSFMTDKIYYD